MTLRSAVWAKALGAAALITQAQRAEGQSFDFAWDAPEACPRAAFVQTEVSRIMGRPWQELGAEWREAQASVTPEAGGFRLRVRVVTRGGTVRERNIAAASCTEATEAAVAILTAGMAPVGGVTERERPARPMEASSLQSEARSARAEGGVAGPPAGDALNPAISLAPSPGSARPIVGVRLGLDFGTLAAAAPFVQLAAGAELGRFSALGFVGATGRVLGDVAGAGAGARMFLLMGGALGCLRLTAQNPALSGCAGVELGSLEASGFGAAGGRGGRGFWSASLAQGVLDWNITGAGVASLGVAAVVPFRHLHVVLGPEEVHRTPSVALRPWLGLGLRFQ